MNIIRKSKRWPTNTPCDVAPAADDIDVNVLVGACNVATGAGDEMAARAGEFDLTGV